MALTAFTIAGKLVLDSSEFTKSLTGAERQGNSLASKLGSGLGKAAKFAGKAIATSVTAASGAIVALSKSAVESYGEYEQLVGGVETLFGAGGKSLAQFAKDAGITAKSTQKQIAAVREDYQKHIEAQEEVMANAKKAYMTAGVDMNSYMQTATSFSAALISGLNGDTKKAAQITDMAVVDMADNANKMGTNLESIQNAYQGFAKQNYTMLDNLKLGYGGTRTEMQRLLRDATKLTGKKYNLKNLADVYEAIHVIQTEMGITGTTADEAAHTIQGSTAMMKAAWENFKISIADPNGNVAEAVTNLVESAKTAAKNYLPVIKQTIRGIATTVKELAPLISNELPTFFEELLPDILDGATTIVGSLLEGIINSFPVLISTASDLMDKLIAALKNSDSPVLVAVGESLETVKGLFNWFAEHQEAVVVAVSAIVAAFAVSKIAAFASTLNPITVVLGLIAAAATLVISNWESIKQQWDDLWANMRTMVLGAWDAVQKFFGDAKSKIEAAWGAIAQWFNDNVATPVKEAFDSAWEAVSKWWTEDIAGPITEKWTEVKAKAEEVWGNIKSKAEEIWGNIKSKADEIWGNIKSAVEDPINQAKDSLTNAWNTIKTVAISAWESFKTMLDPVIAPVVSVINTVSDAVSGVIDWFEKLMGYNGKDLSETTSGHTHTNTTINRTITEENGDVTTIREDGAFVTDASASGGGTGSASPQFARGSLNVPYDMTARIHQGEMVLTKSQARKYREGSSGNSDNTAAMQRMLSAMSNMRIVVGGREFGRTVTDFSGTRMRGYIGQADNRSAKGYGNNY